MVCDEKCDEKQRKRKPALLSLSLSFLPHLFLAETVKTLARLLMLCLSSSMSLGGGSEFFAADAALSGSLAAVRATINSVISSSLSFRICC